MKKVFSVLAGILFTTSLPANIGPEGFAKFVNPYFVETGTFGGDGVQRALDAGFKHVRSIEADENLLNGVKERFVKNKQVTLYKGNSAIDLWNMIKDIDEPITFWLDAHIYPPIPGALNCPVIQELDQIKKHPIKNHIIMIDDMHCCNTAAFDYQNQDDFMDKILEINPNYRIFYIDGGNDGEYANNIMVAICP